MIDFEIDARPVKRANCSQLASAVAIYMHGASGNKSSAILSSN